jgi:hypothetical protein
LKRRRDGLAMSPSVLFVPAGAGRVHLGRTLISGDGVELRDMDCDGVNVKGADNRYAAGTPVPAADYVKDVTLRDLVIDSLGKSAFSAHRAQNLKVIGGEWWSSVAVDTDNQATTVIDLLIEGVYVHHWHDISMDQGQGQYHHIEGLQFGGGDGVTIRGCTFEKCATHCVFIRSWGTTYDGDPQPLRRFLIEGNAFRAVEPGGYYVMQILDDLVLPSEGPADVVVRDNSFEMTGAFRIAEQKSRQGLGSTFDFYGNRFPGFSQSVIDSYAKRGGHSVHDNVYKGGTYVGPGDSIDPNVDLANPPVSVPPVPEPEPDPGCEQCKDDLARMAVTLAQTQADLDKVAAELATTSGQLADALAVVDDQKTRIDSATEALTG